MTLSDGIERTAGFWALGIRLGCDWAMVTGVSSGAVGMRSEVRIVRLSKLPKFPPERFGRPVGSVPPSM